MARPTEGNDGKVANCMARCPTRDQARCDRPKGHGNLHRTTLFGRGTSTGIVFWADGDTRTTRSDGRLLPPCGDVSPSRQQYPPPDPDIDSGICTKDAGHDGDHADGKWGNKWDHSSYIAPEIRCGSQVARDSRKYPGGGTSRCELTTGHQGNCAFNHLGRSVEAEEALMNAREPGDVGPPKYQRFDESDTAYRNRRARGR